MEMRRILLLFKADLKDLLKKGMQSRHLIIQGMVFLMERQMKMDAIGMLFVCMIGWSMIRGIKRMIL